MCAWLLKWETRCTGHERHRQRLSSQVLELGDQRQEGRERWGVETLKGGSCGRRDAAPGWEWGSLKRRVGAGGIR